MYYSLILHLLKNRAESQDRLSGKLKLTWATRELRVHDAAQFDLSFRLKNKWDAHLIFDNIHQLYYTSCVLQALQRLKFLLEHMKVLFIRFQKAFEFVLNSFTIPACNNTPFTNKGIRQLFDLPVLSEAMLNSLSLENGLNGSHHRIVGDEIKPEIPFLIADHQACTKAISLWVCTLLLRRVVCL